MVETCTLAIYLSRQAVTKYIAPDAIIDSGIAFRTSGCPGKFADDISACDRPYGDSPPSDIASYPFQPQPIDLSRIRSQLGRLREGERYTPGDEFEFLED